MIVEILLSGYHASNPNLINLFLQNRNACWSHWSNLSSEPKNFDEMNLPHNRNPGISELTFRGEMQTAHKNENSSSVDDDSSNIIQNQDIKSVIEQGLELEVTEGKI